MPAWCHDINHFPLVRRCGSLERGIPGWGSLDRAREVIVRKRRRHGDLCPGCRATHQAVFKPERPQPARAEHRAFYGGRTLMSNVNTLRMSSEVRYTAAEAPLCVCFFGLSPSATPAGLAVPGVPHTMRARLFQGKGRPCLRMRDCAGTVRATGPGLSIACATQRTRAPASTALVPTPRPAVRIAPGSTPKSAQDAPA